MEPHPDGHANAPKAKIQMWIHKTPDFDSLTPTVHLHFRHGRNHGRMHSGHNRNHSQSYHHHHHYHHNSKGNNSGAGRSSHKGPHRHRLDIVHESDTGNTHRISHIPDEEDDIIDSGAEDNVHIDSDDYVAANIVDGDDEDVNDNVAIDSRNNRNTVNELLTEAGALTGTGVDVEGAADGEFEADGHNTAEYDDNDAGNTEGGNRNGKSGGSSSATDSAEKAEQDDKDVNGSNGSS